MISLTLAQAQVLNNVDPSGQLLAAFQSTLFNRTSTPIVVANGATINLTQSLNILRPTSDATIAGAVINMPTSPVDGQICTITTTAAITTVTGTLSTAPVPATATLAAGQSKSYKWDATSSLWLPA